MAVWNGLPEWMFGGRVWNGGSTSNTDKMDEMSDTLVKQLQAQWNYTHIYPNWQANTGGTGGTVVTTGGNVGTTTSYPVPQYHSTTGGFYTQPSGGHTHTLTPTGVPGWSYPAIPNIGDKVIMEWDGAQWQSRYESAQPPAAGKGISVESKNIEFSLDEIEEASNLIKDLSEKRLEHEAA